MARIRDFGVLILVLGAAAVAEGPLAPSKVLAGEKWHCWSASAITTTTSCGTSNIPKPTSTRSPNG